MAYEPNAPDAWNTPAPGNTSAYTALLTNDAELYEQAPGVVASAYGPYPSATDGSATRLCYFAVPGNYDDRKVTVYFTYSVTGGSATVTLTLSNADDSATDTVTSASLSASSGSYALTLTPSNTSAASTPRYAYLDATCSSPNKITIAAIMVLVNYDYSGLSAPSGVMSSGYIPAPSSSWSTGGSPVPTELIDRLTDNPYRVAKDRLQAIFSLVQPIEDANRGLFFTDTSGATAGITNLALPQKTLDVNPGVPPKVRIWAYVERTSTATAAVVVSVGDRSAVLTGYGILTTTLELGGSEFGAAYQPSKIWLSKATGSGYVALRTLQIIEEPS